MSIVISVFSLMQSKALSNAPESGILSLFKLKPVGPNHFIPSSDPKSSLGEYISVVSSGTEWNSVGGFSSFSHPLFF